jgi:hypothetical protein
MYRRPVLCCVFVALALPALASQSTYTGPRLSADYSGPVLVDNSQMRYTGQDMLSFSTADELQRRAPNLMALRPTIDTWSAMHAIHPRVLIQVLKGYWPDHEAVGSRHEIELVHEIATGLALIWLQHQGDALAASKAVYAVAAAYGLSLSFDDGLAAARELPPTGAAPPVFGWFQPPWEIGDTWAGGGVHGDTGTGIRNALDYWGEYRGWGEDLSQWWVAAMQAGTARVWSICSVSIIHDNGWTTTYYHLENIQLSDFQVVERNEIVSNYANDLATATCQGGSSTGPHVHQAVYHDGVRVEINETNLDFTAYSHHPGVGQYDFDCATSWYNHYTLGKVCPAYDQLLNNAPPSGCEIFCDAFELGNTDAWSRVMP